jgi:hypothetical protein
MALVTAGQGVLLAPAGSLQALAPGLRRVPLATVPASLHSEGWAVLPITPGTPGVVTLREIVRVGSET